MKNNFYNETLAASFASATAKIQYDGTNFETFKIEISRKLTECRIDKKFLDTPGYRPELVIALFKEQLRDATETNSGRTEPLITSPNRGNENAALWGRARTSLT